MTGNGGEAKPRPHGSKTSPCRLDAAGSVGVMDSKATAREEVEATKVTWRKRRAGESAEWSIAEESEARTAWKESYEKGGNLQVR